MGSRMVGMCRHSPNLITLVNTVGVRPWTISFRIFLSRRDFSSRKMMFSLAACAYFQYLARHKRHDYLPASDCPMSRPPSFWKWVSFLHAHICAPLFLSCFLADDWSRPRMKSMPF
ncbi:hypothetical protein DENSPDRAFT_207044 [Dentipellis sp. KUC8613]|nr:hypothetical protein DENSPDRAFT_207044 [Dentipellis sp. KUC8613]